MAWFISYRHSVRKDETGVKFLHSETEAITEGQRLETLGYILTKIAEIPPGGAAAIRLSAR
jgi:hypothetical protein